MTIITGTLHEDQYTFMVIRCISPITGPRCPDGSRKLRFPDYVTVAQDGGKVVSLTHRPLLPHEILLVLISAKAVSTPGP